MKNGLLYLSFLSLIGIMAVNSSYIDSKNICLIIENNTCDNVNYYVEKCVNNIRNISQINVYRNIENIGIGKVCNRIDIGNKFITNCIVNNKVIKYTISDYCFS